MKVKQLDWNKSFRGDSLDAFDGSYEIRRNDDEYYQADYQGDYVEGYSTVYTSLEAAKEACQEHFEKLILGWVEQDHSVEPNDMVFDPTLLGFELFEDFEIRQSDYKVFHLKSNRNINIYLQFKSMKNTWAMWEDENKNHSIIAFELGFFQEVKIPDHDFGVKLITQFLEDRL